MKKTTIKPDYEQASARVGKKAMLTRGMLRGTVHVLATRSSYGRLEYLVSSDNGREWVRESSLEFPATTAGQ